MCIIQKAIKCKKIINIDNIFILIQQMGYNQNCAVQTCTQHCCNINGICPDPYQVSTFENSCYYYYTSESTTKNGSVGGIAGGTVGAIVLVIAVIIIICCCIKKRRDQQAREQQRIAEAGNHPKNNKNNRNQAQLNMTTQQLATQIGNPFAQNTQAYGQPYMQPAGMQPAYGQPYVQPMGYQPSLYPPVPPGMYNPNPIVM